MNWFSTASRYGMRAEVDDRRLQRLEQSVEALLADLEEGKVIYGEQNCLFSRELSRCHLHV